MQNHTYNTMSDEALNRLLFSKSEFVREQAQNALNRRKCKVEEVGKRTGLPKLTTSR